MDFKFPLEIENLKRIRFDEFAVLEWNNSAYTRFQTHIIDFYKVKNYIISSEKASNTGKSHYHFLGYIDVSSDCIRKRLKSHVFKGNDLNGHAAVSSNWKTETKYKHLQDIFTLLEITYAHFHAYYICKDDCILVNTLYPFIKKDGYAQILAKLPQTVQNLRSGIKTRNKEPNYLKLLIKKYEKTQKTNNSLIHTRDKKVNIFNFVNSEITSWNTSDDEHLSKLGDNMTLRRFCQTIFNTFHLNEAPSDFEDIYKQELIESCFRI